MASITDQQHAISHSAPGQAESPAIAPDEAGVASLDKVRDILFGGQMRELDRRFGKVEARLGSETAELREDLRRRLAARTIVLNTIATFAPFCSRIASPATVQIAPPGRPI